MGGKVAKAWSLAGFLKIENSSGSRGALLKWLPLWRPCLPKIYRSSPGIGFTEVFDNISSCIQVSCPTRTKILNFI